MPYRLMLVDDEADIREGMKRIVNFEEYGFELVGEADNGRDGLEQAELTRPDLIITDIRMHFMDGLEMIEKIRAFLPMAQFVVLSGYDEFQYVRRSIQMRIVDYVLKPISSGEFTQVLARAKSAIDQEYNRRRDAERLNEYLRANLPALREQLLCSLLTDGLDEKQTWERAGRYGLDLAGELYAVAVLRETGGLPYAEGPLKGDGELIRVATDNLVRDVISERLRVHVFNYNGRVAVLCLLGAGQSIGQFMESLEAACGAVRDYLGVRCVAGVGEPCAVLSQLPRSRRQALAALDRWTLIGDGNVIYYNDLNPDSSGRRIARKAIELVNTMYSEESFTTESAAERLHISPSYFRTIFKRETGKTFHHYLNAYRMDRAMELLRATDLKTAHIAERIGISEASYFSYSFKKHFGASPSQVRKDADNA